MPRLLLLLSFLLLSSTSMSGGTSLRLVGYDKETLRLEKGPPVKIVEMDGVESVEIHTLGEISAQVIFQNDKVVRADYFTTSSLEGLLGTGPKHELSEENIKSILQTYSADEWSVINPKFEFGRKVYLSKDEKFTANQRGVLFTISIERDLLVSAIYQVRKSKLASEASASKKPNEQPESPEEIREKEKIVYEIYGSFIDELNSGRFAAFVSPKERDLSAAEKRQLEYALNAIETILVDEIVSEFTLVELTTAQEINATRVGKYYVSGILDHFPESPRAPDKNTVPESDKIEFQEVAIKYPDFSAHFYRRMATVLEKTRVRFKKDINDLPPPPEDNEKRK